MKMNAAENYYVYCYIDPRTGKEFYYGKGNRGRKLAHLRTQGKSEKAKRIRQIRAAGAEPIIRVIAAGLTQDHALLVEAALIWKLGEELTNKISGHYTSNFRPQNTLDNEREGFDFSHRSHFFNVGEHFDKGANRNWEDCYNHGFVSTGYGPRFREQARQLRKSDVVLAYYKDCKGSKGHGYVGIGKVKAEAVPACEFRIRNKTLKQMLKQERLVAKNMCHNYHNRDKCEYVTRIKWVHREKREKALWEKGLFYGLQIRESLENQSKTKSYIERKWHVKFAELLKQD
jgi:hypothetical protein